MSFYTFSKASSVFSGLAFRAWEASMMGMGMKRMVKFLMDTQPEDIVPDRDVCRDKANTVISTLQIL